MITLHDAKTVLINKLISLLTLRNLFIVITIIITLLIFKYFADKSEIEFNKKVNTNKYITSGQFVEWGGAQYNYFTYRFYYNGKMYEENRAALGCFPCFKNKIFPVVLDSTNPELNKILVFPREFKKFNIPFPDSLSWVKKYDTWW